MGKKKPSGVKKTQILIVDDHPIVRAGFALLISQQADMEVCGEAESILEAVKLTREKNPNVVVVDISLKDSNGLDLIRRVQAMDESILILVCSMHDESLYAERAIRAGARGYVNKQVASRKMIEAIRTVVGGKIYLSEEMSQRLLQTATGISQINTSPMETLSDRELTVFELIGQGQSTKKIAEQLHLSIKTIETYREKIKEKLHLEDATELTRHAVQWVLEKP